MKHLNLLFFLLLLIPTVMRWPLDASAQTPPPVYVVIFTHIEDNCPPEPLGSPQSIQNYFFWRNKTIAIANLFLKHDIKWVFEPDWTFLVAALTYEDDSVIATTNHKNLLRYLKEDLQVTIDPHSHEHRGYNYTDVAHLLDSLGVGGSTVVGGHVWDPNLPQFQNWDRFRVPVPGSKFPWALWRGEILMGSATPNHIHDPVVSGVWRPKDRYHFFEDDPDGNIVNVGQYKESDPGDYNGFMGHIMELIDLYASGMVSPQYMLTISTHLSPNEINAPNSLHVIEDSLLVPLAELQREGKVKITDFTALVADWKTMFGAQAFMYDPNGAVGVTANRQSPPGEFLLFHNYPNPFNPSTVISYQLPVSSQVELSIYNLLGQKIMTLVSEKQTAGIHKFNWDGSGLASGVYLYRLEAGEFIQSKKLILMR
ncbi:MAG: T9SS type A sorting domain-containing protein [candidate division KSB1 bacterium]|nr:T9SS type A sorting domain-containing protein [candidate division KSB1 bacterium]